jgi:hypothetical protein
MLEARSILRGKSLSEVDMTTKFNSSIDKGYDIEQDDRCYSKVDTWHFVL